jgi:hypothetical protein
MFAVSGVVVADACGRRGGAAHRATVVKVACTIVWSMPTNTAAAVAGLR